MKKIYFSALLSFIICLFNLTCSAFTLLTSVTDPTCSTAMNGTVTITPVGGVAPYSYSVDQVIWQP